MTQRWWKRLWLRYPFYCREHWIIAASITLSVLWILVQVGIQLLPLVVEFVFSAVVSLV